MPWVWFSLGVGYHRSLLLSISYSVACIFVTDIYEVISGAMDLFNCNYDLYLCIYVCYMLATCLDAAYIYTYIIFVFRSCFLHFQCSNPNPPSRSWTIDWLIDWLIDFCLCQPTMPKEPSEPLYNHQACSIISCRIGVDVAGTIGCRNVTYTSSHVLPGLSLLCPGIQTSFSQFPWILISIWTWPLEIQAPTKVLLQSLHCQASK